MRGAAWLHYGLGFLAGATLATYLALSCGVSRAQSPEVAAAIASAARTHGVSERRLLALAWCESRYDPGATSRAGAMGLMQFMPRTWWWASRQAGYGGWSAYNARAAAHTAAWLVSQPGGWAHWRACW